MHGKTFQKKQRFLCLTCSRTFVWKVPHIKRHKERHWFKLWINESYTVRQITKISGHSRTKIRHIKDYWLQQLPPEQLDLSKYKYLLCDGTYFHQDGCLICFKDTLSHRIVSSLYTQREGYENVHGWFKKLHDRGLSITCITMDGERSVMRALKDVWPRARIQRCLYHIQREGMRWLRTYPCTDAGRQLRRLLGGLAGIKTRHDKELFIRGFRAWQQDNRSFVMSLSSNTVAYKDLKKTMTLIHNALPDMFHFLDHPTAPSTTNLLEGFFSRLKSDYRRHRGLNHANKIAYLKWYCYFKSQKSSNTF